MKESTKETLKVFALVFGVGLICGLFGILGGIAIGENRSVERLLSIEKRLDLHDRIHLALVGHINTFYEYVGVKGKMGRVKQDTATALPRPAIMDHDPIPPPAGFEAIIERSIYQNLKKPRVADTVKWEKTESQ